MEQRGKSTTPWAFIAQRISIQDRGHTTPCWVWTKCLNHGGYGRANVFCMGNVRVHRATYTMLVGPIPDGLVIDHLCKVKSCCNPDHLEAVTDEENRRRAGRAFAKTHCIRGHDLSVTMRGLRNCMECQRVRGRALAKSPEWRARKAAYMRDWNRRRAGHAEEAA